MLTRLYDPGFATSVTERARAELARIMEVMDAFINRRPFSDLRTRRTVLRVDKVRN